MSCVLAAALVLRSAGIVFPGDHATSVSPSGHYSLTWVPASDDGTREHALVLKGHRLGTSRELRRFDRWLRVLWSPGNRWLAVTDGVGSDASEAWVYDLEQRADPRNVGAEAVAKRGISTRSTHHLYVEAVRWHGEDELLLRVWGHGDGGEIDKRVRVSVGR